MEVRLCYGWSSKKSRIRAVHMDNLRGLLCIRNINRILNAEVRKLSGVKKGVGERNDESGLWWSGILEVW